MTRAIVIAALAAAMPAMAGAQNSSLYQQELAAGTHLPTPAEGPAITPAISAIALPPPKPQTFAKHDLITIIIREEAKNSTDGKTNTERDSSIDGSVDEWVSFHLNGQMIQPSNFPHGKPGVKADMNRQFDGNASASRTDSLVARIQAEIIDVKPNGVLVLQASKSVQMEENSYTITVTGTCRTRDITPDNTILSTQIAELQVIKEGDGTVKDATKRGVLHKLLDKINLF